MQAIQPLRGHTLYTFAPSGWRPLQGLFILATAPAEFTVYGQKKPRGAISSHFDFGSTRFFFTIFGRKRSHGGPHLYMCDIVWQCGGFFSFFKQQHTKIIDDPSFLGWFQISPRAASTTRDSRAVDRCPPLGGVPKKKTIWFWVMERQRTRKRQIMFLCDDVCTS